MRITGGCFRGRILETPKNNAIRPASDKVRQAVFNALTSRISLERAVILDGFCGTGAYGLEALSRGAAMGIFIDKNRTSLQLCRENAHKLEVADKCVFLKKDLNKRSLDAGNEVLPSANLLFLDPPYGQGLLMPSLSNLHANGWLAKKCYCIFECERNLVVPDAESRFYGDSQIIFKELG